MDAVAELCRVDNPEPDGAVAVVQAWKVSGDVRAEVVIVDGSYGGSVDDHRNGRTVTWDRLGLRCQCPSEVDIGAAGDGLTLSRRVNRAERQRRGGVAATIDFEPRRVLFPSTSSATACSRKIPLPRFGSMLVSSRNPQPARSRNGMLGTATRHPVEPPGRELRHRCTSTGAATRVRTSRDRWRRARSPHRRGPIRRRRWNRSPW